MILHEAVYCRLSNEYFKFGQLLHLFWEPELKMKDNDYMNKYSPDQIAGGFPISECTTRDTSSTYSETEVFTEFTF